MELTINSRKLGKYVTFSRPGKSYIFVDLNGLSGTLGLQPCDGGGFSGSTLSYSGDNSDTFNKLCRAWFKLYIKDAELLEDI